MKKNYLFLAFAIICVLAITSTTKVNSHIAFAPPGYCGDPTSFPSPYTTCATSGCHGGTAQVVTAQNLTLRIGTDTGALATFDNTFKYIPGQTYYVSLAVLVPAYACGFQMTALNPNTSMAGSFTAYTPLTEKVVPLGAPLPTYITHKDANSSTSSWLFQWTAPTTDSAVTFYYAFNASDSADYWKPSTSGHGVPDSNIFAARVTVVAQNVGIENISSNISGLQVYPNPIDGAFSLSFDVIKAGDASAALYSVDGKLCKQLFYENLNTGTFNRNYNIASLAPGIYLVKMNMGGATITKKIVKE